MTAMEFLNELYWNLGQPKEIFVTPEFFSKFANECPVIIKLYSSTVSNSNKDYLMFRDMKVKVIE